MGATDFKSIEALANLLNYRYEQINFVDRAIELGFVCPLDLHCAYSRDRVLSAVGRYSLASKSIMHEGVLYLPKLRTDLLFVDLFKDEKGFSPSTMYQDYAISLSLFHWQSQNTTSDSSTIGARDASGFGSNRSISIKCLRNNPYSLYLHAKRC
jgi:hypothetical protein